MNRLPLLAVAALFAALLVGAPAFAREVEDPNKTIFNPPPPKEHRDAVAGATDCNPRDPDGRPQGLHWNWHGQA